MIGEDPKWKAIMFSSYQNWDAWNLRTCLIITLVLHVFLIICAPLRKRLSTRWLIVMIWSGFLLLDWTANLAIGLISSSQVNNNGSGVNGDLLAFWLPFLLIHLGGPDTIISFSTLDSTLSLRGFLLVYVQLVVTAYVFCQSFPSQHNLMLLPKILLIVVGIIKYAERGYAAYLASLNCLTKSMLKLRERPPHTELTDIVKEGELESDIAVVHYAHCFFKRSRALLIGLLFSLEERHESRMFFHKTTSTEAYKLIAAELNFIYDSLFTKAFMVRSKMGCFLRTIYFSAMVIALISFRKSDKSSFARVDVGITYVLLYGAIAMDIISLLMHIFSDWTVIAFETYMQYSCVASIFGKYLTLKRST